MEEEEEDEEEEDEEEDDKKEGEDEDEGEKDDEEGQEGEEDGKDDDEDEALGEKFSTLSTEDFKQIDDNNNNNMNATTKSFLRVISTSCKAMSHTDQAAKHARRRCFAKPIYRNIPFWNTSIMVDNSKDSFR